MLIRTPAIRCGACALRAYSGQHPGRRSGPRNRLLCRSAPVCPRYTGIGPARLTGACRASPDGRFSAVLLQPDGGLVLFVPTAGAGCRIGPRDPIETATEAVTECASPAARWKTGTVPWQATLRAGLDARRADSTGGRACRCARHARTWPSALATQRHNDQFGTLWKRSSDGGAADHNGGYLRASPWTAVTRSNHAISHRAVRHGRPWADSADRRHRADEKTGKPDRLMCCSRRTQR